MLSDNDLNQIKAIIDNLATSNKKVPYFADLVAHPVYGQFFNDLDGEDIQAIQDYITKYIKDKIEGFKTKGGELFRRFYVLNQDNFWRFRELNNSEDNIAEEEFQTIGKNIEEQLFKFENILTANMMKKPQGLDKTVSAYYDIVYSFFHCTMGIKG